MKQQMLEQEVKELKAQLALASFVLDLATVSLTSADRIIQKLKAENAALRGQNPTVGLGPQGASLDRELANGQPNGFVRPKPYTN